MKFKQGKKASCLKKLCRKIFKNTTLYLTLFVALLFSYVFHFVVLFPAFENTIISISEESSTEDNYSSLFLHQEFYTSRGFILALITYFNYVMLFISFYLTSVTDPGVIETEYNSIYGLLPIDFLTDIHNCSNKDLVRKEIVNYILDKKTATNAPQLTATATVTEVNICHDQDEEKIETETIFNGNDNFHQKTSDEKKENVIVIENEKVKEENERKLEKSSFVAEEKIMAIKNFCEKLKKKRSEQQIEKPSHIHIVLEDSQSPNKTSENANYDNSNIVKAECPAKDAEINNGEKPCEKVYPCSNDEEDKLDQEVKDESCLQVSKVNSRIKPSLLDNNNYAYLSPGKNRLPANENLLNQQPQQFPSSNYSIDTKMNGSCSTFPLTLPEKPSTKSSILKQENHTDNSYTNKTNTCKGLLSERLNSIKFIECKNGGTRVCKYCLILKPDRTHHCKHCRKCVRKFDHHCYFVGNCIGYRNYKYFISMLFHTVFSLLFQTSLLACEFKNVKENSKTWFIFYISTIALKLILLVAIGYLFFFHLWLLHKNLTTVEYKDKFSWKPEKIYNHVFNISPLENFRSVLGTSYALWFVPYNNVDIDENLRGYDFSVRLK